MLLTTSWMLDLGLISILLLFLLYKYATRRFDYFKKRNVFYEKPLPFFGNFKDVVTLKTTIGVWLKKVYDNAKTPYFGIFLYHEPCFVIKDPDLIKRVMIRDFNHFTDRTVAYPEHNKVLSNFLFLLPNPEWKNFRSELSPAFTTGKLKMMFSNMQEVGERYQKYLFENQGQLEAKEVSAKYTTEVISKCFFGINAHCFDDENAIFRVIGRKMFDFTLRNAFIQTAYFSLPSIVKLFKINFFEDWITEYFVDSFNKVFHAREQSNDRRNDFIDILKDMKRKDGSKGRFKMEKIEGCGMQFFVGGFETTSSTIAFTLHELCLNKSIQNRLRKEILDNIKENNGLTFDGITQIKYLDMCIKESLRKYPVLPFLDRNTIHDYKLPETDVVIEKGMKVFIPMYGLHYDEKYFPEPDKYDPERFDGTINHNIDGLVYLPFGEGPRTCIGKRFGLMSTKLALINTLTKYEVDRCSKTPDPVVFATKSLILQSEVGLPMTFRPLVPSSA